MSKIILEFDGDTERDQAQQAIDAFKVILVVRELDDRFRAEDKHGRGEGPYTADQIRIIIREKIEQLGAGVIWG
ncbi:hypothetical protein UFOVP399_20 [uncultured Caudovirales phage]|uniref:Uncharacterized protein n=1 Tax=uncultured Caudovirales phage TaxID=2100421 RepID=A0A6J5M2H3_9CAUD|nr:hypothetical protein UFOVP399_20 [uncultured Caudovirales phage]